MDIFKQDILEILDKYQPFSHFETKDKKEIINWLKLENNYCRISKKPDMPIKHIACFIIPFDIIKDTIYIPLFDHISSGLLLTSGGHLDKNEFLFDCVKRETKEELGIDSSNCKFITNPYFISQLNTTNSGNHVEFWFLVKVNKDYDFSKAEDFNKEFKSYKWYTLDECLKLERTHPHFKRFIQKVIKNGINH